MQLRYYLSILRRVWPLVLALPLLVAAISLVAGLLEPPRYVAAADMIVMQALPPGQQADSPTYLRDQWGGTEYLIDDLPQVVTSGLFSQDVSATLRAKGVVLDAAQVQGSLSASSLHRSVTLQASADTPATALALVDAAVQTLRTNGLKYWGRSDLHSPGINVAELTAPTSAVPVRSTRRLALNVALRSGLGLLAGVVLAFLLHYFDTRVRDRREVEAWVGLPVLGAIPPE